VGRVASHDSRGRSERPTPIRSPLSPTRARDPTPRVSRGRRPERVVGGVDCRGRPGWRVEKELRVLSLFTPPVAASSVSRLARGVRRPLFGFVAWPSALGEQVRQLSRCREFVAERSMAFDSPGRLRSVVPTPLPTRSRSFRSRRASAARRNDRIRRSPTRPGSAGVHAGALVPVTCRLEHFSCAAFLSNAVDEFQRNNFGLRTSQPLIEAQDLPNVYIRRQASSLR
jgi:hypothetical protein